MESIEVKEGNMECLKKAVQDLGELFNCEMELKNRTDEDMTVKYKDETLNKALFSGALFRLVLYEFEIRKFSLNRVRINKSTLALEFLRNEESQKKGAN